MITVNSPLKKKEIIKKLEENSNPSYSFVKEQGTKLYFETDSQNLEFAINDVKNIIKEKVSSIIMVQVTAVE